MTPDATHPCPKGDGCALNRGAQHCFHCGRNWPPDETWDPDAAKMVRLESFLTARGVEAS